QLLAERPPGLVLVLSRGRVGEDRKGDGTEAGKATEDPALVRRCRTPLALDLLERLDREDDVAGLALLSPGNGRGRGRGCCGKRKQYCEPRRYCGSDVAVVVMGNLLARRRRDCRLTGSRRTRRSRQRSGRASGITAGPRRGGTVIPLERGGCGFTARRDRRRG